jgi:hypothetical protein
MPSLGGLSGISWAWQGMTTFGHDALVLFWRERIAIWQQAGKEIRDIDLQ